MSAKKTLEAQYGECSLLPFHNILRQSQHFSERNCWQSPAKVERARADRPSVRLESVAAQLPNRLGAWEAWCSLDWSTISKFKPCTCCVVFALMSSTGNLVNSNTLAADSLQFAAFLSRAWVFGGFLMAKKGHGTKRCSSHVFPWRAATTNHRHKGGLLDITPKIVGSFNYPSIKINLKSVVLLLM